jgi:hypothetical protein
MNYRIAPKRISPNRISDKCGAILTHRIATNGISAY